MDHSLLGLFVSLFIVQLLVCITYSTVYHVTPDDSDYSSMVDTYTLHGLLSKVKSFGSNTENTFSVKNTPSKQEFYHQKCWTRFIEWNSSIIECNASIGLMLVNVTSVTIGNITFINCRRNCSHYPLVNLSKQTDHTLLKLFQWVGMLLYFCATVGR